MVHSMAGSNQDSNPSADYKAFAFHVVSTSPFYVKTIDLKFSEFFLVYPWTSAIRDTYDSLGLVRTLSGSTTAFWTWNTCPAGWHAGPGHSLACPDGKCAAFMSMATSCQFPGIHAVGQGYKYRMEAMLSLCLAEKWHVLGLVPKNILKHKRWFSFKTPVPFPNYWCSLFRSWWWLKPHRHTQL